MKWSLLTLLCVCLMSFPTHADEALPVIGRHEKIRYGFSQWNHFGAGGVGEDEFIGSLKNTGLTILSGNPGEEGKRWSRIAHEHGIRYFAGLFISSLYDNREDEWRLAVDRAGKTCPEYGGREFRVPCPLDRRAWEVLFEPAAEGAKEGWLDGAQLDMEPYGAYTYDLPGEHLCYCDDCFARYCDHANIADDPPRAQRFEWLKQNGHLLPYLKRLQDRLTVLLQELASNIRKNHPTFGFAAYPDWIPDHLTGHWRMQALALGLNHPDAPFIVINSTPYWEDHSRPWWEAPIYAYRAMGLKHVMGSWDGGLTGHHPEVQVGAAQAMYEFAMASDGFWRWGERQYSTEEWQSVAQAHRMIRDVESRLGGFLFQGEPVRDVVTLVEHTGNPLLDRALVTQAYAMGDSHLVRVFNGNTDWPVTLSVRFPHAEEGSWQLRDGLHDAVYVQADGTAAWSRQDLFEGLTLTLDGRDEVYLVLEPSSDEPSPFHAIRSLAMQPHRPRPFAGPPVSARLEEVMADDFGSGLGQWDLSRIDPGDDGHAVRVNARGQLEIDSGVGKGNGRGFLLTKKSFPPGKELCAPADPGQVFFRVAFTIVSSSSPHAGGLLVGATLDGDDAGGTRILDALATSDPAGRVVPWAVFREGGLFSDSDSPVPTGLDYTTRLPHQPGKEIRVDWIAGSRGTCERIEVFVDGERDGVLVDTTGRDTLGFEAGPLGFWLLLDRDLVIDDFTVWQLAAEEESNRAPAIANDETGMAGYATPSELIFTSTVYGDEVGYRGQNLYQQVTTALAIADAESGKTRPLYKLQGYCREPVLSRDRKVAAASVWVNGKGQIYLFNTRTGRGWNISNNEFRDRSPGFSPDRRALTFLSDRDGSWQVYVMNADGSEVRCVSTSASRHRAPSFSPDGSRIAFASDREGDFNIYTVKPDGSDLRVLAPQRGANAYDPVWSPDGEWLCWSIQSRQLRRLVLARADGSGHRELAGGAQAGPLKFEHGAPTDITSLQFSPDGSLLAGAFTDYRTSGIFVLDVASGRIRKLVDVKPLMPYPFDWYATGAGNPRWLLKTFTGVRFSPDGRSLVYCTNHHQGAERIDDGLLARRGLALHAMPIPDLPASEQPEERINLYVPGDRTEASDETEAVMLPGTATTWPAETSW